MKKMVLFTYRPEIGKIYYDDLCTLFGEYMEIHTCSLNKEEPSREQLAHADIVLVSNAEIINKIHYLIKEQTKIVTIDFSYPEMNIEQMRKYPAGTYALMCFDLFVCRKMVSLLYEQGINNFIWLFPQENGEVPSSGYDVVVVDDYSPHLVRKDKTVMSLGKRKIAFSTLLKIAQEADIFNKELENELFRYSYSYKGASTLVNTIYSDMSSFHLQIKMILNYMDSGIVILSDRHEIIEYNTRFMDMFHITGELYGKKIKDVEGTEEFLPYLEKGKAVRNELIVYPDGKSSLVFNMECIVKGNNQGWIYMLILQEAEEIENKSHSLKRQLSMKGYTSKYRFSDIKTESPVMISCIKKAEKIARIDKTTLVMGESGTGKELMAQSLHSASSRRNYPFVSINCAAIPSSLLESELFGYVEGAFTGSKKGGKIGLFEMANYGTLFLDEIGEASLEVQSKLLRAIETKEIMRLGGDKITSVDVRIIAATNQNLKELVDKKEFRLDLYYRLNSIIIKIPPLRERKEDIRYLAEYFIYNEIHKKRQVEAELWDFMERYSWQGNVRELRNVMEYMVNITDAPLKISDLPDYIRDEMEESRTSYGASSDSKEGIADGTESGPDIRPVFQGDQNKEQEGHVRAIEMILSDRYSLREKRMIIRIMTLIESGVKSRKEIGKGLAAEYDCTGYKLKKILENLRSLGLISFSRGPEGIILEKKGREFIKTRENS